MRFILPLALLLSLFSCDLPQLGRFDRVDDPVNKQVGASRLEASTGDRSVTLVWRTDSQVDGYYLYYQEGTKVDVDVATRLATVRPGITVDGLANGTAYAFAYAPYSGSIVGQLSSTVVATPGLTPTQLSVVLIGTTASLSWTKYTGATSYRVYAVSSGVTSNTEVSTNQAVITSLIQGQTYAFSVAAVAGTESAPSKSISVSVAAPSVSGTTDLKYGATILPQYLYEGRGRFTQVVPDSSASGGWFASGRSAGSSAWGQALLTRFNSDLSHDLTFGNNAVGLLYIAADVPQVGTVQYTMQGSTAAGLLELNGKVLLATSHWVDGEVAALFRFSGTGVADTGFNSFQWYGSPWDSSAAGLGKTYAMGPGSVSRVYRSPIVAPDGSVLQLALGPYGYLGQASAYPAVVLRLSDPDLVTSDAPIWISSVLYPNFVAAQLAVQSTGKVLVAGTAYAAQNNLVRLNTNGTVDSTFASSGWLSFLPSGYDAPVDTGDKNFWNTGIQSIQVDATDKLILAASFIETSTQIRHGMVVRLTSLGALDTGFNGTGVLILPDPLKVPFDLKVQADGKILVVGDTMPGELPGSQAFVARVNSNGTLDTSFGTSGQSIMDAGFGSGARGVAVDASGKIAVVGFNKLELAPNMADTLPALWLF